MHQNALHNQNSFQMLLAAGTKAERKRSATLMGERHATNKWHTNNC